MNHNQNFNLQGQLLVQTLVLTALAVIFIAVLANLAIFNINTSSQVFYSEQAFQIAEAGIEYYRWHLAHDPNDYQNGTGQPGPYTIDYSDKDGNVIGQFILDITPPQLGSTVITIKSTGKVNASPRAVRTVSVKLGRQSLAKYAVLANDKIKFATDRKSVV